MNILLDARESGTTTGRYIDKLIEHLSNIKTDHRFIILCKPNRLEFFNKIAPEYSKVVTDVKDFSFQEQIELNKIIRAIEPDLVHFGIVQQPIRYKGKSVTTMHDLTTLRFNNPDKNYLVFKFKQLIYRYVNIIVARKSKYIITPSEFVKKDIHKFAKINNSKIIVTYEAADLVKEKPLAAKDLVGKKFIMYVGRPTPHKNLKRLIQAHQEIIKINPDLYLSLSGKIDANYQDIKNWIEKKKFKNIVFTGFVNEQELKWLYQNTEAYVFPSLSEGFGLPGIEAMVHGAPVISSNATCLPEIYGDAATYFNPKDVSEIATRISEVIASPKLREQLIKKGYSQAKKYSWKKMAEETLKVYDRAL